jgi:hypothetical protein
VACVNQVPLSLIEFNGSLNALKPLPHTQPVSTHTALFFSVPPAVDQCPKPMCWS